MARQLRTDHPGAWHHLMNRGARRTTTFVDDDDRHAFMRLLGTAIDISDVELHGYCLMGNHYHLLVHTPSGGLADFMQFVGKNYTQRFNRRHGHDGALFRGRYHSELVDTDGYLLTASRYIHRNPAELGSSLLAYRWSSLSAYLGLVAKPAWLSTQTILDLAGGAASYERFVLEAYDNAA